MGASGIAPRGGRQQIPRPPSVRIVGPAPWSDLRPDDVDLSPAAVRAALAAAGPRRRHPVEQETARPSAVLAPLYEHDGTTHVVFTRRSQHLRSHRGEVSFPGGRHDDDDTDLVATALREAWEETRLGADDVEIVGELDHLTTVSSRSVIVPYVGLLSGRPDLEANPEEVEAILHLPLADLLAPEAFRAEQWDVPILDRPVYFFEVPGDTIWGATAAMLVNLLCVLADRPVPSGRVGR